MQDESALLAFLRRPDGTEEFVCRVDDTKVLSVRQRTKHVVAHARSGKWDGELVMRWFCLDDTKAPLRFSLKRPGRLLTAL